MSGLGKPVVTLLSVVVGVVLAVLTLPTPARGATNHPWVHTITGERQEGERLGEGQGTPSGGFWDACGVALDSQGDLYVSNYFNDAVDVFNTEDKYRTEIANEDPTNGPCGLSVDSASDIFVNNWRHEVVKFTPLSSPPGLGTPYHAAGVIDPGPATAVKFDPTTDRIYVDDGSYVAAYEPSGAPVEVGGRPLRIGEGTLREGYGLAVSDYPETEGEIYVPDAATDTVKVYDPTVDLSDPVKVIDGSGTPRNRFTYLGNLGESEAAIDPTDGHLFVLDEVGHGLSEEPEIVVYEFNAEGDYRGQILAPPTFITKPFGYLTFHRMTEARPSGIAIGSYVDKSLEIAYKDAVYVSGGYSEGSGIWIFGATVPSYTLSVTKTGTGGGTVTSQPFGLNCGSACAAEYEQEQIVKLFAVADAHSDFTGWSVEGPYDEPCPGTGSCTVAVFGDTTVQAGFERAPQKTLEVSLEGNGTVESEPAGISCPARCSEEFAEGRAISLIAKPAPHRRLAWSGCESEPSPNECEVTMSQARSVAAEFTSIPQRTIQVSESDGGGAVTSYPAGIYCPGECSASFDEGSTVYLTAALSPGFGFGGFRGGGCHGTATICAVKVAEALVLGAEFVTETPPIEEPLVKNPRPPTGLPPPTLTLRRLPTKRGVLLAATVSGAGWVSVISPLLRRLVVEARAPGTIELRLRLGGSGRTALRRDKHHRLQVEVTGTFMPSFRGNTAIARKLVTFGRARPRR